MSLPNLGPFSRLSPQYRKAPLIKRTLNGIPYLFRELPIGPNGLGRGFGLRV